MENIFQVKDENGIIQYPITSKNAVNTATGVNIDDKLNSIPEFPIDDKYSVLNNKEFIDLFEKESIIEYVVESLNPRETIFPNAATNYWLGSTIYIPCPPDATTWEEGYQLYESEFLPKMQGKYLETITYKSGINASIKANFYISYLTSQEVLDGNYIYGIIEDVDYRSNSTLLCSITPRAASTLSTFKLDGSDSNVEFNPDIPLENGRFKVPESGGFFIGLCTEYGDLVGDLPNQCPALYEMQPGNSPLLSSAPFFINTRSYNISYEFSEPVLIPGEQYTQPDLRDFKTSIDTLEETVKSPFKERPDNGIVGIAVSVNTSVDDYNSQTLAVQDLASFKTDYGVLYLPESYSTYEKPTKLLISCHGYTGYYNNTPPTSISDLIEIYFDQGWAVMDMNGLPNDDPTGSGTEYGAHYGAPFTLSSYIAGYNWVVDNYNIDRDGVLLSGASMGGLSSFMIAQSGVIPVLAQIASCPALDLYKQGYCHAWASGGIGFQRNKIAEYYGFTGTKPTFTNNIEPTEEEKSYFMDNIDKWIGYNPIMKNVINLDIDKMYSHVPLSEVTVDSLEDSNYSNMIRIFPHPLKIWHNTDDNVVAYRYSKYLVDSIQNAGGLAHLRTFTSGGHNSWANGDKVDITLTNGTTKSINASTYEQLMWLKKFS